MDACTVVMAGEVASMRTGEQDTVVPGAPHRSGLCPCTTDERCKMRTDPTLFMEGGLMCFPCRGGVVVGGGDCDTSLLAFLVYSMCGCFPVKSKARLFIMGGRYAFSHRRILLV